MILENVAVDFSCYWYYKISFNRYKTDISSWENVKMNGSIMQLIIYYISLKDITPPSWNYEVIKGPFHEVIKWTTILQFRPSSQTWKWMITKCHFLPFPSECDIPFQPMRRKIWVASLKLTLACVCVSVREVQLNPLGVTPNVLHHVTVSQRCDFRVGWTRTRRGKHRQEGGRGVSQTLMLPSNSNGANKRDTTRVTTLIKTHGEKSQPGGSDRRRFRRRLGLF